MPGPMLRYVEHVTPPALDFADSFRFPREPCGSLSYSYGCFQLGWNRGRKELRVPIAQIREKLAENLRLPAVQSFRACCGSSLHKLLKGLGRGIVLFLAVNQLAKEFVILSEVMGDTGRVDAWGSFVCFHLNSLWL